MGQAKMNSFGKRRLQSAFVACLLVTAYIEPGHSQGEIASLASTLEEGTVQLLDATGNGSSSGAAVEAYLLNTTTDELLIGVYLADPIYFDNRGVGQDMIGSEIYLADGGYLASENARFIALEPGVPTPVLFIAYCAQFERDNPSRADSFSIRAVPEDLRSIMRKIAAFSIANPETDSTAAAQAALWLTQGVAPEEIRRKFPLTDSDEGVVQLILE